MTATLVVTTAIGWAQPAPEPVPAEPPATEVTPEPVAPPAPASTPTPTPEPDTISPEAIEPGPPLPDPGERPSPPLVLPEIVTAPTGRLLAGGVIYSRSGLDTSGGFSSDLRVGLGDVAEFGVGVTDLVRGRRNNDDNRDPERISPYFTATFKMGIAEDRLFRYQPALALGFRKSFEAEKDGHRTRIAELYLVASKRLGRRAEVHAGGVFWDASIQTGEDPPDALHDRGIAHQLRGFGGMGLRPLDHAEILVDVYWVPEFCYVCSERSELRPLLSWGVRYHVASWLKLDSGVRVPDIQGANLLDAQIFAQVTFLNQGLRRTVERLR